MKKKTLFFAILMVLITNISAMNKDEETLWDDIEKISTNNVTDPLFTEFHEAAFLGNTHKIRSALIQRSDVDSFINEQTTAGFTPLHLATSSGYISVITLLLQHSADTTLRCNAGYTAEEIAILLEYTNIATIIQTAQPLPINED